MSESELNELHDRFAPGLLRHFQRKASGVGGARRIHGDLADELAQRTWIEFWKALEAGTYDPARSKPSTFLYGVASIIWLRSLRERGRDQRVGELPDGDEWLPASDADDPAHAADLAGAIDAIRRLVNGTDLSAPFSDADREILRAVSAERTEREIADQLGVSPSTAHERKRALLGRVADFLRARGIDWSGNSRATGTTKGEEPLARHP